MRHVRDLDADRRRHRRHGSLRRVVGREWLGRLRRQCRCLRFRRHLRHGGVGRIWRPRLLERRLRAGAALRGGLPGRVRLLRLFGGGSARRRRRDLRVPGRLLRAAGSVRVPGRCARRRRFLRSRVQRACLCVRGLHGNGPDARQMRLVELGGRRGSLRRSALRTAGIVRRVDVRPRLRLHPANRRSPVPGGVSPPRLHVGAHLVRVRRRLVSGRVPANRCDRLHVRYVPRGRVSVTPLPAQGQHSPSPPGS